MSVLGIQVGQGIQQAADPVRRSAREAKQLELQRKIEREQFAIDTGHDQSIMANELETTKAQLETVQTDLSQTRTEQSKANMGGAFRMLQKGNYDGFRSVLNRDITRFGEDSIAHQIPWLSGLKRLNPEAQPRRPRRA